MITLTYMSYAILFITYKILRTLRSTRPMMTMVGGGGGVVASKSRRAWPAARNWRPRGSRSDAHVIGHGRARMARAPPRPPHRAECSRICLFLRHRPMSVYVYLYLQPSRSDPCVDRRLAQQTKLLKERNASLLRAVSSVKQNPSSSTVYVPGTSEEYASKALTPSMPY